MNVINIPNTITITRIILLPFFAATLIYDYYAYALLIFIISALTDIFDGYLARLNKQTTRIGAVLDPIADKFLLVTSFVIISIKGWIPVWLTIIVLSRDLVIVSGWLILAFVSGTSFLLPSYTGKAAVFFQFILVGITLLIINSDRSDAFICPLFVSPFVLHILVYLKKFLWFIVAGLTAFSGIQYTYRGLKLAG